MDSKTLEPLLETGEAPVDRIELPAPTVWPFVLALGVALLFAGLLTSLSVSILGVILAFGGCVGWFHEVLPREHHESVLVTEPAVSVVTSQPRVAYVQWVSERLRRGRLPVEIYPISAGIKGGLAGSVAMALLAVTFGIVSGHGIWYPINLLSAGFFPQRTSVAEMSAFSWDMLIVATVIHLICSLVVGLLYGAMLPMFPRRPILLGGLIAPILWSGLLHSILEVVDPVLNREIDWFWFVLSQIGFGLVAGTIVSKQERVQTWQFVPFAVRAGVSVQAPKDGQSEDGQSEEDKRQ